MRRLVVIVAIVFGLGLAAWLAMHVVDSRRFRDELSQARADFEAGRFASARARLNRLAERRPGDADVELLRGESERRLGKPDDALAAWDRIPRGTPQEVQAALSAGRMALGLGRFRLAETKLLRAVDSAEPIADEARQLLELLYWTTGRRDEQRALILDRAQRAADPSEILRSLWGFDRDPYPIGSIDASLANARRSAPDDDLVWLASADAAMRSARFAEASAWLDRCEQARPDDPAVALARLDWAKAVDRPEDALRAASRVPASAVPVARVLAAQAWLAARAGDRDTERKTLDAILEHQPANDAALEGLADLATQDGAKPKVLELRRRKAAIDTARDDYRALINLPDLAPRAAELARAAEAIGRWPDAKLWWVLAARREPSLAEEARGATRRLEAKIAASRSSDPRTLAEVLAAHSPRGEMAGIDAALAIPTFEDQATARGLVFTYEHGPTADRQLPETMHGGVALLDFDGDGWLDVYALQGGPFPPSAGPAPFGDRLFRNRGDGTFDDVTTASGLADLSGGYGHGVAVGDYDNDGRPDLFLTRWRSYALYHNLGSGRFEDVTASAGLEGDRDWPTSAAWADLDNDGDLDLYVCHYVKWDAANPTRCEYPERSKPGYMYCDPLLFPSLPDHVFRNDAGRFVDVTEEAGIVDTAGRGLGVVADDIDGDGLVDLFVANDLSANLYFRNLGGFRFSEQALEAGLAASAEGGYLAGMGIARGDLDGDGLLDLAVTNFLNQATTLYHNHGGGLFSDRAGATGLAAATRQFLGFGLAAIDANNDGWLDLVQANGHVSDFRPSYPYAMTAQLLLGNKRGQFRDVSDQSGPPWQVPRVGRGLAAGDLDNDGHVDALVVGQGAPLASFRNVPNAQAGHFLTIALEGVESNRDGVGAFVTVTARDRTWVASRFGGGSYLSAGDPRLHIGLGEVELVDRIEVRWPSGRRDTHKSLAVNTGYRLREGVAVPGRLPGFTARAPH